MPQQTLILTLQLDAISNAFYEHLRRKYFPPERNLIAAHVTLFHQLPDDDHTRHTIRESARATEPFRLTDPAPRSIGKGVAVFFQAPPLLALQAALAQAFDADIIPQDRQRFRPDIVVQNKVAPELARQTLPLLQSISLPEPRAIGLTLSRYLNGPWQHLTDFPFQTPLPI